MKNCIYVFLLVASLNTFAQDNNRSRMSLDYAKDALAEALKNEGHNVVNGSNVIINDTITAVAVAEPVLYKTYGKKNIDLERPYDIFHLEHHWIISGTLPKHAMGGTFLIIIDDRNGKIVRLTHSK